MRELNQYQKLIKHFTDGCDVTEFEAAEEGKYPYVILPIESRMTSEYLDAVIREMIRMLDSELGVATCLVIPEAKAFLLGTMIGKDSGLPVVTLKKNRDYRLPGQVTINTIGKAYKGGEYDVFYTTGLREGDRPLLVDDMISSGWTPISMVKGLALHDYNLVGIGSLYERGAGIEIIKDKTGYDAKGLARLEIIDGKPVVTRFWDSK